MGVFENVEVLGRSGADLETELLHHQTSLPSPETSDTSTGPPLVTGLEETTVDRNGGENTFDEPESSEEETLDQQGHPTDLKDSTER